jgi:hypothetical protein
MKCYNCFNPQLDAKAETCELCGALTRPLAVKYYYVHPIRFVLLNLVTLGYFHLYWVYKNWLAIKTAEKTSIRPFWRALFHMFFCFNFFRRIYSGANAYGYKNQYSASRLVISYIFSSSFLNLAVSTSSNIMVSVPFFSVLKIISIGISVFLSSLPSLLVQPAIGFHNAHVAADHDKA